MPAPTPALARLAGVLYLVLIACGVGADGLVRAGLAVPGDAHATAANLATHALAVRVSALADVTMALADVGLGVALLLLLWRAGPGLAVAATAFRLAQAAVLGLNLGWLVAAVELAPIDGPLAALALELHGIGYDLGLFFFAVNCVLTSVLFHRAGFPRVLAVGLAASGLVYGTGSTLALVAPAAAGAFELAYVVPLVAELGTALWLTARTPVPSPTAITGKVPAWSGVS